MYYIYIMNNSFINYEDKLDKILLNLKEKNKNYCIIKNIKKINKDDVLNEQVFTEKVSQEEVFNEDDENKLIEKTDRTKDYFCKQLDSLNYIYEMHKVRKNKKADFDIHSTNKYSIEDDNIDKCEIILGWKDLSNNDKNILIENFVVEICSKYNLENNYVLEFVNSNIDKVKYDKSKKKIIDLNGMIQCVEGDKQVLKIKQKIVNKNSGQINKLRKSLVTSKKSRLTI